MGRNKFSQREIEIISNLLRLKTAGTRFQQKQVRHKLRVNFEFNISDYNVQGKAFGPEDLEAAIRRGAIKILDEATIAAMKEKRARDKARDEAARAAEEEARQAEAIEQNEQTDWQAVMKEWEAWEQAEAAKAAE